MTRSERAQETEDDPFSRYVALFRHHIAQVSAHLRGDSSKSGLEASFIAPTGYWEPEEKDVFFHALSVYSRLRPDLIADCLQNKTVIDVCTYLDRLEEGFRSSTDVTLREELDIAVEVPRSWLQREEEHSATLIEQGPLWEAEEAANQFQQSVDATAASASGTLERRQLIGGLTAGENFSSLLCHLDGAQLRALDRINRDAEDGSETLLLDEHPSASPSLTQPAPPLPSASSHAPLPSSTQISLPHQTDADSGDEDSVDLSLLSPMTRRRIQKRLYMRRKRAETSGVAFNEGLAKLKPGRRKKARAPKIRPNKDKKRSPGPGYEAPDDDDAVMHADGQDLTSASGLSEGRGRETTQADLAHPRAGGKTKYEKAFESFSKHGVTTALLDESDLSLFNLSAVARFIQRYREEYECSACLENISSDTIRLLKAIVVEFVTQAIHLTIISREQELKLKSGIKVWHIKQPTEILPRNVEHAIEALGLCSSPVAPDNMEMAEEDAPIDDNDKAGATETEEELSLHQLPTHREIYAPMVQLPSDGPLDSGNSSPLGAYLKRSVFDEDMMPDETDDEALDVELVEEEELNKSDEELERKFAKHLWDADWVPKRR